MTFADFLIYCLGFSLLTGFLTWILTYKFAYRNGKKDGHQEGFDVGFQAGFVQCSATIAEANKVVERTTRKRDSAKYGELSADLIGAIK